MCIVKWILKVQDRGKGWIFTVHRKSQGSIPDMLERKSKIQNNLSFLLIDCNKMSFSTFICC